MCGLSASIPDWVAVVPTPAITGRAKWIRTACTRSGVKRITSTKAMMGQADPPPAPKPALGEQESSWYGDREGRGRQT